MRYLRNIVFSWLVLVLPSAAWAQGPPVAAPAAPVPAQIADAKKVFIVNMGTDAVSAGAFKREQAENKPYDEFYAATRNWGRYQPVDTPGEQILSTRLVLAHRLWIRTR